jgi:hypothetical protein
VLGTIAIGAMLGFLVPTIVTDFTTTPDSTDPHAPPARPVPGDGEWPRD